MALYFGSRGGVFVETPSHAVTSFNLKAQKLVKQYPFHRFQYAIEFSINHAANSNVDVKELMMISDSVKIPGVTVDTEIVNEYNRQRLVHTKLSFEECTVVLYDTADGNTLRLWQSYYNFHFKDGRTLSSTSSTQDFGYDTGNSKDNDSRYFFDHISIYEMHGGQVIETILHNPVLTKFEHDTFQYSEINELARITFSLKPEYIEYVTDSASLPQDIIDWLSQGATNGTATQQANSGSNDNSRNSGPLSSQGSQNLQQAQSGNNSSTILSGDPTQQGSNLNTAITGITGANLPVNSNDTFTTFNNGPLAATPVSSASSSVFASFGSTQPNVTETVLAPTNNYSSKSQGNLKANVPGSPSIGSVSSGNQQGGGG